jgi:hypothetical protein
MYSGWCHKLPQEMQSCPYLALDRLGIPTVTGVKSPQDISYGTGYVSYSTTDAILRLK